jgi:hypothetical protein
MIAIGDADMQYGRGRERITPLLNPRVKQRSDSGPDYIGCPRWFLFLFGSGYAGLGYDEIQIYSPMELVGPYEK